MKFLIFSLALLLAGIISGLEGAHAAEISDSPVNNALSVDVVRDGMQTATAENTAITTPAPATAVAAANTVRLPVLARKVDRNQPITAEDLTYVEMDRSKLKSGYITEASDIIGKSAVRMITLGKPMLASQITEPKVISRNQKVIISYHDNVLFIQDTGIALSDGGKGDVIKFRNANSARVVYAKIINSQNAEVLPVGDHLASN